MKGGRAREEARRRRRQHRRRRSVPCFSPPPPSACEPASGTGALTCLGSGRPSSLHPSTPALPCEVIEIRQPPIHSSHCCCYRRRASTHRHHRTRTRSPPRRRQPLAQARPVPYVMGNVVLRTSGALAPRMSKEEKRESDIFQLLFYPSFPFGLIVPVRGRKTLWFI